MGVGVNRYTGANWSTTSIFYLFGVLRRFQHCTATLHKLAADHLHAPERQIGYCTPMKTVAYNKFNNKGKVVSFLPGQDLGQDWVLKSVNSVLSPAFANRFQRSFQISVARWVFVVTWCERFTNIKGL